MADPQVRLSLPPSWFFKFPPDEHPESLPPPLAFDEPHIRSPFNIDPNIYNKALSPALPVIFAITYIFLAATINRINGSRGYRPYWISQTRFFSVFVILHNVGLAVYSIVTCAAMLRAVSVSFPGFFGPNGFAGAADALCKMHGPRGFGDAVLFEPTSSKWLGQNRLIRLASNGLIPDPTDVGRIWNEGLAFWGWLFYLSKFYEVVDTMIILAKGKRSSTLQTYHHAGAMLCMWAGIRYMSPPIWMFVLVNAGIHAMMYTYYTLSALKFRVPGRIKRLITSLQILQFLVGASYASLHLFVSYKVPVSVHQSLVSILSSVPPAASEAAAAFAAIADDLFTSASIGSMAAEATAHPSSWLMKLLYRAGGAEGLAETVHNSAGDVFGHEYQMSPNMPFLSPLDEVQYRTELREVHCLDTSGEAFAIWLNVVYLAPLTVLFVRFFVKTYIFRTPKSRIDHKEVERSASDAADETKSTAEAIGKAVEKKIGEALEGTKEAMRSTGTEGYKGLVDKGLTSDEAMQDAVDEAADADRNANLRDLKDDGEGAHFSQEAAGIISKDDEATMPEDSIANLIRREMRSDGDQSRSSSLDSEERSDKENLPPVITENDATMAVQVDSKTNGYHDDIELSHDSVTSLEESGVLVDFGAYEGQGGTDPGEDVANFEPSVRSLQAQQSSTMLGENGHLGNEAYFGKLNDIPTRPKSKSSGFDKVWFGSARKTPKKTPLAETPEPSPQEHSTLEGLTSIPMREDPDEEIYSGNLEVKSSSEENDAFPKPLFAASSYESLRPDSKSRGTREEVSQPAYYSDVVKQNEASAEADAKAEHTSVEASTIEDTNPEEGTGDTKAGPEDRGAVEDAQESVSYADVVKDSKAFLSEVATGDHIVELDPVEDVVLRDEANLGNMTEPDPYSETDRQNGPTSLETEHEDSISEADAAESLDLGYGSPAKSEPSLLDEKTVEAAREPAVSSQAVKDDSSASDHARLQEEIKDVDGMASRASFSKHEAPLLEPSAEAKTYDAAEKEMTGEDDDVDGVESATPRNETEEVNEGKNDSESNHIQQSGHFADTLTSEPSEGEEGDETAPDTASSLAHDDRSIDTLPSVSVDSDDIAPAAAEHVVAEPADESQISAGDASRDAARNEEEPAIDGDEEELEKAEALTVPKDEATKGSTTPKTGDTSLVEDHADA